MGNSDWFVLIDQWTKRKMGDYGVTLPFLVGALGYKAGEKSLGASHVRELLAEMVNYPVEGYLTECRWCDDIEAPVFSVVQLDSPYKIQINSSFPRPDGNGHALGFSPDLQSEYGGLGCKEAVACIDKLVAYASVYVEKSNFSRNRCENSGEYEYGPFHERDIQFITETILGGKAITVNGQNG